MTIRCLFCGSEDTETVFVAMWVMGDGNVKSGHQARCNVCGGKGPITETPTETKGAYDGTLPLGLLERGVS